MSKILIGYLSYLTKDTFVRREFMTNQAANTFKNCFKNQDCDVVIINNGEIIPEPLDQFNILNLSKNYYDVAVHFCTAFLASRMNLKYFGYVYDDFLYYDDSFISKAISFLEYTQIKSMRLPAYKYADGWYDTRTTSKSENPDAVRHESGANRQPLIQLKFEEPFFISNWRPNSRPMLWNTEYFIEHFIPKNISKVMQKYEGYMYDIADELSKQNKWTSSFLNGGMCKTFPVETSLRTSVPLERWNDITINVNDLKDEVKEFKL